MAKNTNLGAAKLGKNDEFYTQYADIEAEMNAYVEFNPDVFRGKTILCPCDDPEWSNFTRYFVANFTKFGLKKLISTSYARGAGNKTLTLFEMNSPHFDESKHEAKGRLYTLTSDQNGDDKVDSDDLVWDYLEGDGDFRSMEVTRLRDEADFVITNPPFSLFREFIDWIIDGKRGFSIIGNVNAITYKEVFRFLRDGLFWLGDSIHSGDRKFNVPDDYPLEAAGCGIDSNGKKYIQVKGVRWYTNIDFKERHTLLELDTMSNNLKFNKTLRKKLEKEYGCDSYPRYDNYDAIEVPFTECIPSDYDGVMGVPITFLDKYCPEQFNIIDITKTGAGDPTTKTKEYPRQTQVDKNGTHSSVTKLNDGANIKIESPPIGKTYYIVDDAIYIQVYPRILIRPKKGDRQ
ncbi:MAG: adenosine deaminase [Thermoguttaceae bacterium]|nr:adenosine deaminase [Thermoguttaceae bacterium]